MKKKKGRKQKCKIWIIKIKKLKANKTALRKSL